MRVFDYVCEKCSTRFEAFVRDIHDHVQCPQCGAATMNRQLSAPRAQLEGISGAFPTAADAWEKRRESHMKKEKRNMERHNSYD